MGDVDEQRLTLGMPDVLTEYPVAAPRTLDGLLGFELLAVGADWARGRATVTDRARQRFGLVHGGVYCALAEMVATEATLTHVWPHGMSAVGLSNQTNFLRPLSGDVIEAHARALERGDATWFWDVSMLDQAGRLCAVAVVTIAVRRRVDP
jgi:1,4-dihydroxy-2-naphthoyl-CoA hydrolase